MAKKSNYELKNKFVELRAKGTSYSEISETLKVSKPTLIEWAKQLEIEIDNLKAIYLDELFNKYFVSKALRVELFGKALKAIHDELTNRDLKDVTTDKLLEMLLKFSSKMREEEVSLSFRGDTSYKEIIDMNTGSWKA